MTPEEVGPAREYHSRNGTSKISNRDDSGFPVPVNTPLRAEIRVTIPSLGIELGFLPFHGKGLLVGIYPKTADLAAPVEVTLGSILPYWEGKPRWSRVWTPTETPTRRRSGFERLEDGALRVWCEHPRREVTIPSSSIDEFGKSLGLLLSLADRSVGVSGVNLPVCGGQVVNPCPVCGHADSGCRTCDFGITRCVNEPNGSIATTTKGAFVHVFSDALPHVRVTDSKRGDS